jgi:hypothetical protein
MPRNPITPERTGALMFVVLLALLAGFLFFGYRQTSKDRPIASAGTPGSTANSRAPLKQ